MMLKRLFSYFRTNKELALTESTSCKVVISPEFNRARSEVESLRLQLEAKKKAAFGIFLADNLSTTLAEDYDDLDFRLFLQGV
jgi:hypothetical protein